MVLERWVSQTNDVCIVEAVGSLGMGSRPSSLALMVYVGVPRRGWSYRVRIFGLVLCHGDLLHPIWIGITHLGFLVIVTVAVRVILSIVCWLVVAWTTCRERLVCRAYL